MIQFMAQSDEPKASSLATIMGWLEFGFDVTPSTLTHTRYIFNRIDGQLTNQIQS